MAKMIITRGYWVDWICVFDKQPNIKEIRAEQARIVKYLQNYLTRVMSKTKDPNVPCVFDEEILEWDAKKLDWGPLKSKIKDSGAVMKGKEINWLKALKWEWDQISSRPLVFNFKAYFEDKGLRFTADTKGSMTPPPPPPPPGS